jgi:hypothetical protein
MFGGSAIVAITMLAMPNAGEDRDFERPEDRGRAVELVDPFAAV